MHPVLFIGIIVSIAACAAVLRYYSERLISGRFFMSLVAWSLFLVVWEGGLYSGIFKSVLLASPTEIISKALYLIEKGYLQINTIASLSRFMKGFVIGIAAAVPFGLAIGSSKMLYEWTWPVLSFLRVVPPPAILPFAILLLGIGEAPAVFVIALGCFFPTLINTVRGVREAEKIHIEVVQTMGGGRMDTLRHVILPSALPAIMTGIRIGFGIGWLVLVSSEIVAADTGLGFMIEGGRNRIETPTVFTGMTVICIIGLSIDFFLKKAESFFINRNWGGYCRSALFINN